MPNLKKTVHTSREPLIRLAKRDTIPLWESILIRAVAILLALVVCGFLIYAIVGLNPIRVYISMAKGAFGSEKRIWVTLRDTMMLLCIGIGLAPAFKMRFWNIGAEGQILVGGIASAACMLYLAKFLPNAVLLPVMFILSALAGALWAFLPALFKARWNTNETLFTLMMNYVAIQLTSFFVAQWEHPFGSNSVGIINQSTKLGWFPAIFGQNYLLNVILVLTLAALIYCYLKYSKHGYEISVVGESQNTARYAGIRVGEVFIRTMLLSGAICGVAGFLAVAGASHTISVDTAGGQGFTAIIVAWLSKFNTGIMILVSLLLVFLNKGALEIASAYNLNSFASQMITGIILFFILGCEFFIRYRIIFRGTHKEG